MIKKILTISTISCAFLFLQPCYSLFSCCCGEDEIGDTKTISQTPSTSNNSESSNFKDSILLQVDYHTIKGSNINNGNEKRDEKNAISERQICVHNGQIIEFPKDLSVISNTDECRILMFKDFIQIQIFPSYDVAVAKNPRVRSLHEKDQYLKNKRSLTGRMATFRQRSGDNLITVEKSDRSATEGVINCIEIVVDKYPDEGPFPVKFSCDDVTGANFILFRIEDAALFVEGPAK